MDLTKSKFFTWYSILNPLFSFRDMFAICAFMFLTGMFLLVGGPRFVFSGKAYVDSTTSFACTVCDLQSSIDIMYSIDVISVIGKLHPL